MPLTKVNDVRGGAEVGHHGDPLRGQSSHPSQSRSNSISKGPGELDGHLDHCRQHSMDRRQLLS